jgi:(2Fe-2S) ferredoxin
MTVQKESPYVCHVFVCTNDRSGERKSCADNKSPLIRKRLKEEMKTRGWEQKVRISQSGCMGLCGLGSNVMLYPQKIWFSDVYEDDLGTIISSIETILNENN